MRSDVALEVQAPLAGVLDGVRVDLVPLRVAVRTGLEVVAHDLHLRRAVGIGGLERGVAVVEDHVVDDLDESGAGDLRVARRVVGEEVVVNADVLGCVTADEQSLAVLAIGVRGLAEPLGDDVPGEGDVVGAIPGADVLVHRPAERVVVDDHVVAGVPPDVEPVEVLAGDNGWRPVRKRRKRMTTSWVLMSTRPLTFPSAALRVMPPPGAVCPATVRYGSSITICSRRRWSRTPRTRRPAGPTAPGRRGGCRRRRRSSS